MKRIRGEGSWEKKEQRKLGFDLYVQKKLSLRETPLIKIVERVENAITLK